MVDRVKSFKYVDLATLLYAKRKVFAQTFCTPTKVTITARKNWCGPALLRIIQDRVRIVFAIAELQVLMVQ